MKWPTSSISLYTWNAFYTYATTCICSLEWNKSFNEKKNVETKGRAINITFFCSLIQTVENKYWLCRFSSMLNLSINPAPNQRMVMLNKSSEFLNKLMLLDIYEVNKCQWFSVGKFSLIFSSRFRISMKDGLWLMSWAQHCSVNLKTTWKAKVHKIAHMIKACLNEINVYLL